MLEPTIGDARRTETNAKITQTVFQCKTNFVTSPPDAPLIGKLGDVWIKGGANNVVLPDSHIQFGIIEGAHRWCALKVRNLNTKIFTFKLFECIDSNYQSLVNRRDSVQVGPVFQCMCFAMIWRSSTIKA